MSNLCGHSVEDLCSIWSLHCDGLHLLGEVYFLSNVCWRAPTVLLIETLADRFSTGLLHDIGVGIAECRGGLGLAAVPVRLVFLIRGMEERVKRSVGPFSGVLAVHVNEAFVQRLPNGEDAVDVAVLDVR